MKHLSSLFTGTLIKKLVLAGSTTTLALGFIPIISMLQPNNTIAHAQQREDIKCNCVLYARSKVPSLPRGLFSYKDKTRIINSYTPAQGSVAIMNIGSVGHVAYVSKVFPNGEIEVDEANYYSCQQGLRKGTPRQMKVVGYFKP